MRHKYTVLLGKTVRSIARMRGGGSALPGLFVEKIDPNFTKRTLSNLPKGVVVISGTNGKTTTTKMVVELLENTGLKVFTNRTGSNFSRGVTAALLGDVDSRGKLDADIAVLELDEAHAVSFVKYIPPRYSLILNVMRDQLDRFGETDKAAKLLDTIAQSTTDTVVLNREDQRIASIANSLPSTTKVRFFGLSETLRPTFLADDLHSRKSQSSTKPKTAEVTLEQFHNQLARFKIDGKNYEAAVKLRGTYNVFNAAAALSLVREISNDTPIEKLVKAVSEVTPAFGRGEQLTIDDQPLEIILVKNPGGFKLSLESFTPKGHATMIAINDNYADGRDMSWLWDVDFSSLKATGVDEVSGVRAYDMALRLQYDEVDIAHITTDIPQALKHFLNANKSKPKHIYCTYTAMLKIRRELAKLTDIEVVS